MKRFLSFLFALVFIFTLGACNKGNLESNKGNNVENEGDVESKEMERDYVYLWNQSGVGGVDKVAKIQTEKYAVTADATKGAITAIGAYVSSENDK